MLSRLVIIILAAALLVSALPAFAQNNYPKPIDSYVNDFAEVIDTTTEAKIRQLLSDLKTIEDVEMTVVTIDSIADYRVEDQDTAAFATNLFNTWGIGNVNTQDGVLLLIAVEDRAVEIKVGAVYENTLNDAMQGVINENLLPAFRRGDYNGGIYDGTRFLIGTLTGTVPAPSNFPAVVPTSSYSPPAYSPSSDSDMDFTSLLWIVIIIFGVGMWIYRMVNGDYGDGTYDGSGDSDWSSGSSGWGSSNRGSSFRSSSRSSFGSSSRSSSSGRKFGGGRSSGGGASGKW